MGVVKGYPTTKGSSSEAKQVTTTDHAGDKTALDVDVLNTIAGTFTPSGLTLEVKITTMDIDDTAGQKLPATALISRNSMSIDNKDIAEILYVGPSNVTADNAVGVTSGWEVASQSSLNLDIADDIDLYARAPAGKTIRVKIMELA